MNRGGTRRRAVLDYLAPASAYLPFAKERAEVHITKPVDVEGSRFKYITLTNSAEQAIYLLYSISVPRGDCGLFKFMCPRSVYAYYRSQMGDIVVYIQAGYDPRRPRDAEVEAAVIPMEEIHLTYIKRGDRYVMRRPTEVSDISFSESGLPRGKTELGIAEGGTFYFNPDFMEVPINHGYTVYVYPKGFVIGKYGTYTNMFTIFGEKNDGEYLYEITATVMHIYNTSRTVYAYVYSKQSLDKPAWTIEAAVSLAPIHSLSNLYVKCRRGDKCINSLELANPCDLSDCVTRSFTEDFTK